MSSDIIRGYPNPAENEFIIDITSVKDNSMILEIYDVLGNKLIQQKHSVKQGQSLLKTNLEALPNGVYFVRLIGDDSGVLWKQRVVKQ